MSAADRRGFSLVEVVVTIAILGLVTVPICSSFVVAHRVNAKSDALLQDRLAVSSVIEQFLAVGIHWEENETEKYVESQGVTITRQSAGIEADGYDVTVTRGDVSASTWVRQLPPEKGGG